MFNYAYVGGVQTPSPSYPGESVIDAATTEDVADQIAERIHSANRDGKASTDAGNLMALATVAGQVEQHQERLEDVVDVITTLGEEQQEQAQQIARLEGQVQSIPQPDLEQQKQIAQEVLTLELRTRNETQAGLAAIRAEREAAAAEYQELSSLLSEQVTTAETWRTAMEERIATATGEAALAALRPMLSWWEKVRPLLEGLRGITAISNPEPGVTEWTASPAVAGAAEPLVVRTKAAQGQRGYRGAQGRTVPAATGGGGGAGAGGLTAEVVLQPRQEVQVNFIAKGTAIARDLQRSAIVQFRFVGSPINWHAGTLTMASVPTDVEGALTVGAELGSTAYTELSFRIAPGGGGNGEGLRLFVTSPVGGRFEAAAMEVNP